MKSIKNLLTLQNVLAIIIVIGLIIVGFSLATSTRDTSPQENIERVATIHTILTIDGLYDQKSLEIPVGTTALAMLTILNANDPQVQLLTETYEGLGVLVTGIGGVENGTDNKYWQYSVNGDMPMVGADQLIVHNGDLIKWEFKASEF